MTSGNLSLTSLDLCLKIFKSITTATTDVYNYELSPYGDIVTLVPKKLKARLESQLFDIEPTLAKHPERKINNQQSAGYKIPVHNSDKSDPLNLMSGGQPPGSDVEVKGQTEGEGHSQTVAQHYNKLQESGRETRTESRIFYMRNFNNWIKSIVISETLQRLKRERGHGRDISVLDLCSGKGGDLLKWKRGGIKHIVCTDIAATSVEQSEIRYKEMVDRERFKDRVFSAEFIPTDLSKSRLQDLYKDRNTMFDISSCQFSFHYCFESYPQVQTMLQNAVENLKLGGYFIGTTPNSQELVRRLRDSDDMSFGNEVFKVTFDLEDKTDIPLFGARYNFHLEGVVDCPEFLVFFPVLEKMAEKHGMKLIFKKPFTQFFNEYIEDREHKNLLGRMQALETYPPESGSKLMGLEDSDYVAAKAYIEEIKSSETREQQQDRRRPLSIGTLSKAEWESVTIYCVFMFQKVKDMTTGEEWTSREEPESSSRKRPAQEASNTEPPKVLKNT